MRVEISIDLRFNIAALCVAILRDDIATPEQAFAVLEGKRHKLNSEDTLDMAKMNESGVTYRQIADIYGITHSSVAKKMKQYKRRISQTAI